MDSTLKAAIISAAAVLAAAVIGAWKLWAPSARSKTGNISAQTGDVSDSQIALGNNNNQHQGGVQNYYGSQDTGPFAGKVETKPSMAEIIQDFRSAKPFDRAQLPNHYVGVLVSWPVQFSSIEPSDDNQWCASFGYCGPDQESYLTVMVDIDIEKYPKLRIVSAGHRAWIEGTIKWTSGSLTRLASDADITLE